MIPELRPLEGKYEILRKLREGGMGAIYLVRHRLLEELRVVKVMRPQLQDEGDFRERFLREAKVAIQLRHPNIAQLYDFAIDEAGAGGYMVLEFVDGRNLQELIAERQPETLDQKVAIARQALAGLGFLHRRGFVHRDVSPDNLMVTRDHDGAPLVKLIDLGIVKVLHPEGGARTGTQVFLGKIRYASPEQFESSRIDQRSDLYSFGVLLYELLTGVFPIRGSEMHALISGHLFKPPIPFEESDPEGAVPEPLRRIVLRALLKPPDERFQSAEEFARGLAELELPAATAEWRTEPTRIGSLGDVLVAPPAATDDSAQERLDERFALGDHTPEPQPLASVRVDPSEAPTHAEAAATRVSARRAGLRPARRIALAVGLAGAALATVLVLLFLRRPPPAPAAPDSTAPAPGEVAAPVAIAPGQPLAQPPAPAAAPAWLRIDAAPWGEVVALTDDGGAAVAAALPAATPLSLRLAPGGYRVTVRDPRTGRDSTQRVELGGDGTAVRARLAPIAAADYFRALGIEP